MRRHSIFTLLVTAALAGGCGGSGSPTAPSAETLSGTWKATSAEFVSASNSSLRVEVVSRGTSVTLTIESSGAYTQRIAAPNQPEETSTGSWSASSDVLTLRPSGMSFNIQFDMTLNGNSLTLRGGHVLFDVNGDDSDEETILNLTMTRS